MRIALFTLESLSNAEAVRRFMTEGEHEIVLLGLSDPYRPSAGGAVGQIVRHLRRSGPRFLPYLAVNFTLPALVGGVRGRGLGRLARRLGIPVETVREVNGEALRDRLRQSGAELILSFHFDQIFDAATLAGVPRGGINVHPSLLPRHRGPVPAFYALMDQPRATGVTIHRLAPRIDAGAILAQAPVTLAPDVSAIAAAATLHEAALPLLGSVLRQLQAGETVEHSPELLPYCPFPAPALLREAARRGVRLAGSRDFHRAFFR